MGLIICTGVLIMSKRGRPPFEMPEMEKVVKMFFPDIRTKRGLKPAGFKRGG